MRKRLLGLEQAANTGSRVGEGAYDSSMNDRTYSALEDAARHALTNGFTAIVDASFLSAGRRSQFRRLAETLGVPCRILACEADPDVLRERIRARREAGDDPSEADESVLEHQLRTHDPLTAHERACTVIADTLDEDPSVPPAPGRPRPGIAGAV
jgi:predicted kinase